MPPENNQPSDQFSQIVDRLKSASNVLVTVSKNPSIDQLASCIGLTIALNKLNKHATAVFSGEPPSTIEFLKPADTLEKNTDSLRDFIISLDKAKADKLRYKVENDVVKIFITPYKTSISDKDFEFSQGDFNVDAVVAIGVRDRNDLDETIVAHGRILHDATVISLNTQSGAELGSINLIEPDASSLCEIVSDIVSALGPDLLDAQIATAFLTGIVAETDRFRNEKSSPHTMSISGILMTAGASTQLIASKLEEPIPEKPVDIPQEKDKPAAGSPDGMIEIDHKNDQAEGNIHIDESGNLKQIAELESKPEAPEPALEEKLEDDPDYISAPSIITEPPRLGGQLTANSVPEYQQYTDTTDPLSAPSEHGRILSRSPVPDPLPVPTPEPIVSEFDAADTPAIRTTPTNKTLSEIEESVNSPHIAADTTPIEPPKPPEPTVEEIEASVNATLPPAPDEARDAVQRAVEAVQSYAPDPIESLGANNVDLGLEHANGLKFEENDGTTPPTGPPPPVPPPLTPPA